MNWITVGTVLAPVVGISLYAMWPRTKYFTITIKNHRVHESKPELIGRMTAIPSYLLTDALFEVGIKHRCNPRMEKEFKPIKKIKPVEQQFCFRKQHVGRNGITEFYDEFWCYITPQVGRRA